MLVIVDDLEVDPGPVRNGCQGCGDKAVAPADDIDLVSLVLTSPEKTRSAADLRGPLSHKPLRMRHGPL
jgi:hypothetical protein